MYDIDQFNSEDRDTGFDVSACEKESPCPPRVIL